MDYTFWTFGGEVTTSTPSPVRSFFEPDLIVGTSHDRPKPNNRRPSPRTSRSSSVGRVRLHSDVRIGLNVDESVEDPQIRVHELILYEVGDLVSFPH